ncbi:Ca2+-transporting ATPase [Parapedobacter luteus]|uniref:Ca2+-transporting ATPase n=1 Tax=Parapedobacter luteus TaxID=623280 RepID=A0A1T5ALP5_9SPHI|nr:cation-translocating P-type ATPase [Parapedobacter luteus]SKB35760.1 Ca2+-transporting ATPase [Parapedobacter luteus]
MASHWHQQTAKQALEDLGSSPDGLHQEDVSARREHHGFNKLKGGRQKSKIVIFVSQFMDVMIGILAVAAAISFFVGEHTDAYVILGIILGNAIIGYIQESRAEASIQKLQQMAAQQTTVVRGGAPAEIEASQLVPGDVVLLDAGDIVPADGRLLEISALKVDEAMLTGESHAVEKHTAPITGAELLPGDRLNMVFKGTVVSNGSAKMVVTEIGMATEMGKIASLLEGGAEQTPLQRRLRKFSKQLVVVVLFICAAIFAHGLYRGEEVLTIFLTALSLAVAALPEALPAVITIALANGAARMVKQQALIRRLPAVETLGSVTYICSDKTGTLTKNKMTVERVWCPEEKESLLLNAFFLNNEIRFDESGKPLGDATEIALVAYALEKGIDKQQAETDYPIVGKVPFDSERMRMSSLHQFDGKYLLLVKGAPGQIADTLAAGFTEKKEEWLDTNREWAREGLRVLFFGYKWLDKQPEQLTPSLETDLDFLGMAGMIDPPREEVVEAIQLCTTAGIKPVMITGDQPLTAVAIAERLKLITSDHEKALTGAELNKMSDDELKDTAKHTAVYARVSPEQKLKIVKALQQNGEFVAMTGDGVNDAPSLKQANIGVAMGITGTDVSKETADMILLDDNFATIVKAIKEGRRIYDNIRRFILYVLSCNLGEILVIFFAPILGLAIPLLPIHILWINLVTDGLPGLALASEPAENDAMRRPPRRPDENLFAGRLIPRIVLTGCLMAIGAFVLQFAATNKGYETVLQQTMVFSMLSFVQLGNALIVRSLNTSLFRLPLFRNPFLIMTILFSVGLQLLLVYAPVLQPIFKTAALPAEALWLTAAVSVSCVACIEGVKLLVAKISGR